MSDGFFGVYLGICTNDVDPEVRARIKAIIPQVFGNDTTESDWALPCLPPGDTDPPVDLPVPGQMVWFSFQGGDPDYPVWLGVMGNGVTVPQ